MPEIKIYIYMRSFMPDCANCTSYYFFFKKGTKISEVFHCSTYVLISNTLFYIRLFVHVVFISLDTRLQSIGKFYKKYSGLERVKGAIRSHNLWSALCKAI